MIKYLFASILLVHSYIINAQPIISFDTVVSGLSSPVDAKEVNDNSNRIFIVEQTGKIRILNGTTISPTPFLDVAQLIATQHPEQGLLSLAFHPDYKTNGYFFIYYTNLSGDITIARYTRSTDDLADSASGVILMTIPKPFRNHNGGNLLFGSDRFLYFGTGDGGSAGDPYNNAQDDASLLGKMLRIDVNNPNPPYYSIPATNPFAGSTTTRPEIISKGLRNPWRWSFDKGTGDMWLADVGQNAWEEVNVLTPAELLNKNFGWKCFEGTHVYGAGCPAQPNNVFPVFEYPHNNSTGGYTVTGGYVYRGSEYPALQGYYICTDYATGNGWLIKSDGSGGWNTTMQQDWPASISSFAETADGSLYATSLDGVFYKVLAANPLAVKLSSFEGRETGNKYEITWHVQNEEPGDIYIVEKRKNSSQPFAEINRVTATTGNTSNSYSLKIPLTSGFSFYRLKIVPVRGGATFSKTISSNGIKSQTLRAFITGTNLLLKLPAGTTSVEIFDAVGKSLLKRDSDPTATQINIPLTMIAKGIITIQAVTDTEWQVTRVLY